jgi:hypothetical protein
MSEMPLVSEHTEPKESNHSKTKIWLILSQVIAGLILVPWCGLLLFASMIGWPDVIEAEGGWDFLSVTFSLMLFYPVLAIIPVFLAWNLYAKKRFREAAIVTSLPILMFITGILLWLLGSRVRG